MRKRFIIGIMAVSIALVGTVAGMASAVWFINQSTKPWQHVAVEQVPAHRVGIVFGALVYPNHQLSPILRDRVEGGIALYRAQKVQKLLMTGDNSSSHYDEVTAMKDYAVTHGVPAHDIALDYAGFDTYDSCYRARAVFGLHEATLITQRYHMPRALFLCRRLGLQADGLGLADFSLYPDLRFPTLAREFLADQKAWWSATILHPRPRFLGDPVTID